MLKRRVGDELWCISQPDHAAAAGYLAAHWGNDEFARPGWYAPCPDPERLRAETVLAVAEHDNGWWEWEADPRIDPADGLPLDLTSLDQSDGLQRWRLGVPRFRDSHPYVALLISLHAYWLHAPRVRAEDTSAFLHPLFGSPAGWPSPEGEELEEAKRFVAEQHILQELLVERIKGDPAWAAAVEPWNLRPHTRLLQACDALSLHLCFGGDQERTFRGIPRTGWTDRVSLSVRPAGEGSVVLDPYPFDQDPLAVTLRARILNLNLHFSSRGEAKCVRGPSGRGASRAEEKGASRLARAGVLEGTSSTASKRNEVMAVVSRASTVGWGDMQVNPEVRPPDGFRAWWHALPRREVRFRFVR